MENSIGSVGDMEPKVSDAKIPEPFFLTRLDPKIRQLVEEAAIRHAEILTQKIEISLQHVGGMARKKGTISIISEGLVQAVLEARSDAVTEKLGKGYELFAKELQEQKEMYRQQVNHSQEEYVNLKSETVQHIKRLQNYIWYLTILASTLFGGFAVMALLALRK